MFLSGVGNRHSLYFGGRYKVGPTGKTFKTDAYINGGSLLAGLSTLAMPSAAAGLGGYSIFTGGTHAASSLVNRSTGEYRFKPEDKVAEPLPEPPEETIKKAITALDERRQKQRAQKDGILKAFEAEQAKLKDLQAKQVGKQEHNPSQPLTVAQEMEDYQTTLAIQGQEKIVGQMKVHAEAAMAIDNQFESQMREIKKRYQVMLEQLRQIEQNKKILEMQKNLEQLKGSSLQSPELKNIQEQLDSELGKSNALVDDFLLETDALNKIQNEEQRERIDKLKQSQVKESL